MPHSFQCPQYPLERTTVLIYHTYTVPLLSEADLKAPGMNLPSVPGGSTPAPIRCRFTSLFWMSEWRGTPVPTSDAESGRPFVRFPGNATSFPNQYLRNFPRSEDAVLLSVYLDPSSAFQTGSPVFACRGSHFLT